MPAPPVMMATLSLSSMGLSPLWLVWMQPSWAVASMKTNDVSSA
jgi:hypothetical protein